MLCKRPYKSVTVATSCFLPKSFNWSHYASNSYNIPTHTCFKQCALSIPRTNFTCRRLLTWGKQRNEQAGVPVSGWGRHHGSQSTGPSCREAEGSIGAQSESLTLGAGSLAANSEERHRLQPPRGVMPRAKAVTFLGTGQD